MHVEEITLTQEAKSTYAEYRGNSMATDTEIRNDSPETRAPRVIQGEVLQQEQLTVDQLLQRVEQRMESLKQQNGDTIRGKTLSTQAIRQIVGSMTAQEVEALVRDIAVMETKSGISEKKVRELRSYKNDLQEIVAEDRQKEFAGQEAILDTQLASDWIKTVGGENVQFVQEEGRGVSIRQEGKVQIITMPPKPTLADVVEAAKLLGQVDSTDVAKATNGKVYTFARQLKGASALLAKQTTAKGERVFDDSVIEYLYNYGEHLQALATGEKKIERKTRDQIQKDAGVLLPEYYEIHLEERELLSRDKDAMRQVEGDYANTLFLFLLGKENRRFDVNIDENHPEDWYKQESFYYKLYHDLNAKGRELTPKEYEKWLLGHKKLVMSALSQYVNDGRLYNNAGLREGLQGETKKAVSETLFEAASQHGRKEQRYLLQHIPGISDETLKIANGEIDPTKDIIDLLREGKDLKEKLIGESLQEQIRQINDLVLRTYGLEDIKSPFPNYFPAEALQKGEFGCSIQALVMTHMLREIYGDEFILMADTIIAGKDSLTGHIRLIAIPKGGDASKALYIDTVVNAENTKRVTDISEVDDPELINEALAAYRLDPKNFHMRGTAKSLERITGGKYQNIGNVDAVVEGAIWNNYAATLVKKADETNAEFIERRRAALERGLLRDSSNATMWAQLANLYSNSNKDPIAKAKHNAYLEKAKALDIHVENLQFAKYTVDAYTPPVGLVPVPGVPDFNSLITELQRRIDAISVTASLEDLDPDTLRQFRAAFDNLTIAHPGIPALVANVNLMDAELRNAYNIAFQNSSSEAFSKFSTLPERDKQAILAHPVEWIQEQFDQLYQTVRAGEVLESPLFQRLQTFYTEAVAAVANTYRDTNKDLVTEFTSIYQLRLYAIVGRRTAEQRQVKEIGQAVEKMGGIDGVFAAMALDEGRVGNMYQRVAAKLETERLARGGPERRLQPDVIYSLQDEIIAEALKVGIHSTTKPNPRGGDYAKYEPGSIVTVGVGEYAGVYTRIINQVQHDGRDAGYVLKIQKKLEADYLTPLPVGTVIPPAEQARMKLRAQEYVAKERTRQDVTRSVRLAYDLSVITARDAVIAARSEPPVQDFSRFRSDPTGVNAYNLEGMLIDKFNLLNHEETEMLEYIKEQLAVNELRYNKKKSWRQIKAMDRKELIEIGTVVFKDLFAVPDFYSSGWRINGVLEGLKEKTGHKGEELALFMQLKYGTDYFAHDPHHAKKGTEFRIQTWEKISRYYPEEMVRIMREKRGGGRFHNEHGDIAKDKNGNVLMGPLDQGFWNLMMDNAIFDTGVAKPADDLRSEAEFRFDEFKRRYDGVLNNLRQESLKEPSFAQVDWEHLTPAQKQYINRFFDDPTNQEANKLQQAMLLMRKFANPDNKIEGKNPSRVIGTFVDDAHFGDIYTRTLRVDDIPLSILQKVNSRMKVPVGAKLASQISNDALIRSWNDTNTAMEAAQELLKFLMDGPMGEKGIHQKIEQAEKFAAKVDGYNGVNAGAEVMRGTAGSLLLGSETNFVLDALGIEHLPFNIKMNKLQHIFGLGAGVQSRRQIKALMYSLREKFTKAGHSKKDAELIVNQIMRRLRVDWKGTLALQGIGAILVSLVGIFSTILELVDLKAQLKG